MESDAIWEDAIWEAAIADAVDTMVAATVAIETTTVDSMAILFPTLTRTTAAQEDMTIVLTQTTTLFHLSILLQEILIWLLRLILVQLARALNETHNFNSLYKV